MIGRRPAREMPDRAAEAPTGRRACGTLCARLRSAIGRVGGGDGRPEDRRKRAFLVVALLVVIPALLGFASADLARGGAVQALPALILAALLAHTLAIVRLLRSVDNASRVIVAVSVACLIREIAAGGGGGYAILWAYLLPVGVFFLFGRREGSLWAALIGVVTVGLLVSGPHAYPGAFLGRFPVVYLLLAMFGFALESAREDAARGLLERQEALELALGRIRTITGLIPICCSCKSIRNDRGAWNKLEEYLWEHTEAELTHGICPECLERLYPEQARLLREHDASRRGAQRVPGPPDVGSDGEAQA